jgi:hypothetical protein
MRFKSKTNGYTRYAASGVNTISFAVDFEDADTTGLLGFAVERHDLENGNGISRGAIRYLRDHSIPMKKR